MEKGLSLYAMTYNGGTMLRFEVRLLGAPQVSTSRGTVSFLPDKRYQLLAYLAYQGEWVNRDELAYLFWSDTDNEVARHNLRQLLKRLKLLPLADALEVERERLRWQTSSDVHAFKQALVEQRLDHALELYTGVLLKGLESDEANEFHSWLGSERESLHTRWRETVLRHGEKAEATVAATWLQKLLEHDPLDEEAFQVYLSVLAKAGQTREALQSYERFAKTLEQELGLEPTSVTEQLYKAIQSGAFEHHRVSATLTQVTEPERILPTPSSALIGRELELSEIAHLLSQSDCRLLTLTGLGGVGKSRLALQAAYDLAPSYANGVYFVPLESLNKGAEMFVKIAELLKFKLQAKPEPLEQFTAYLQDKKVLLILDNFEHLLDKATLVAELVQNCPTLKVIVTSRERLNLEQEQLLPVQGLPIPEASSSLTDALSADGARLFIDRAKRVRPDFAVTKQDLPHLVDICQRLEGVPLVLELAAVWVRLMPLSELSQDLATNLDLLESQSRNRVEQHRSIRAAFDHSWNLLNEKEQEALRKLSVFRGGFTREAAWLVADTSVALLATLVDKSLLRIAEGRYNFHSLLQQYALEKLEVNTEETNDVRANHADFFVKLAESIESELRGKQQKEWLTRLEQEHDNLTSGLAWTLQHVSRNAKGLQLAGALRFFWYLRGYLSEGRTWLDALLAKDFHKGSFVYLKALCASALLTREQGDYAVAQSSYETCIKLGQELGAKDIVARSLTGLGNIAHVRGDHAAARNFFEQSLAFERVMENDLGISVGLHNLAGVAYAQGDYPTARAFCEESLAIERKRGDQSGIGTSLVSLGQIALEQGDTTFARTYFEEGLAIQKVLGDKTRLTITYGYMAQLEEVQGEYVKARKFAVESLKIVVEIGYKAVATLILNGLARLAVRQQEFEQAAVFWGTLERLLETTGIPLPFRDKAVYEQNVEIAKAQLGDEAFTNAWTRGKLMELEQIVSSILNETT
jgi:predicted ATPase/DNA-binding SARP family transcriptional activator